jgi:hypothetical protein
LRSALISKAEKEKKTDKKRNKTVCTHDLIIYVENLEDFSPSLLELSKLRHAAKYKVNMQKSYFYVLAMNSWLQNLKYHTT